MRGNANGKQHQGQVLDGGINRKNERTEIVNAPIAVV